MNDEIGKLLLSDIAREFANQRQFAERALSQIDDGEFFQPLGEEDNTIAIIVKHVGGNLRSRWTDFLATDGEKPDRDRDGEFEDREESRDHIVSTWNQGFAALEHTLGTLTPTDLIATIRIRGEEMPVIRALNRSLAHTSHHVGQIILLAKHFRGARWQTLSIPRAPKKHNSTQ